MAEPEVAVRKASAKAPILSLVDREYLKSVANIPKQIWEPMSYLYSEADHAILRVKAMNLPPDLEWAREATMKNWNQVLGWLDQILQQSQSIDALRSWQLTTGLQGHGTGPRASSAVMPDFPQPTAPGAQPAPRKKGWP